MNMVREGEREGGGWRGKQTGIMLWRGREYRKKEDRWETGMEGEGERREGSRRGCAWRGNRERTMTIREREALNEKNRKKK